MSKPLLDKDEMKIFDLLSLKEAFEDIERMFAVGERVVGTPGEFQAVKIIESRFNKIGLKDVHLEPFRVMTSFHELSEVELMDPIHKKIACSRCTGKTDNQGFATGPEGITGNIVDVGFGRIQDLERLKSQSVDLEGKIVLIEEKPRTSNWMPIAQAQKAGASAAIITSVLWERDILRNPYGIFDTSIPAVSIPYIEAQAIRRLLREGEVKANLKNIIEINVESTGYNVVGDIPGNKYPEEIIILTAHHDSWFGAANDDLCGVAVMMQVAKAILSSYVNKRTIRFVTCGGEEGGPEPDSDDIAYGLAGSYAYTKQHRNELTNIVANINLDGFAYGINSTISLTYELEPLTKKLIEELESEDVYELMTGPGTGLDQWSFIRQGVPSVSINPNMEQYMKIYHSARDTPELISEDLLRNALKLTLSLVLKLDSNSVLPYDFTSTANKIMKELSDRSTKVEDALDLKKLIENTTSFKVIAENFKKKFKSKKELDDGVVFYVNKIQRDICSSLIPKLTERKSGISMRSANTIPAYLDALINIKKTIVASKRGDKETCIASLKSLTENLWAADFSPEFYDSWLKAVLSSKRAKGLRFDLMTEARGLVEKFKEGVEDMTPEIYSLEEKYKVISNQVEERLSDINQALIQASSSLNEVMFKIQ